MHHHHLRSPPRERHTCIRRTHAHEFRQTGASRTHFRGAMTEFYFRAVEEAKLEEAPSRQNRISTR